MKENTDAVDADANQNAAPRDVKTSDDVGGVRAVDIDAHDAADRKEPAEATSSEEEPRAIPENTEKDRGEDAGSRRRKPFTVQTSPVSSIDSDELASPYSPKSSKGAAPPVPKTSLPAAVLTALAITLHNLPEGLATFISFLSSTASGIPLAVAIAVHNIPEGICVGIPIWLSTGSKWKGFLWGTASGLSEPLGAIIGWAIVGFEADAATGFRDVDPVVYAVMFGLTGGMMMYVSFKELLPMAFRCDRNDRVTTWGLFGGMLIMAVSLGIFQVAYPGGHHH